MRTIIDTSFPLPVDVVDKINNMVPRDKYSKSPTADLIQKEIHEYDNLKISKYHMSFLEFVFHKQYYKYIDIFIEQLDVSSTSSSDFSSVSDDSSSDF